MLHASRTALTQAPHIKLHQLRRFDDRLEAHLDGLLIAGEHAWPYFESALGTSEAGAVFTATVRALSDRQMSRLDQLFGLCEAVPEIRAGLLSAFGWSEAEKLRDIVVSLLRSENSFKRYTGIAACAMHRLDPGLASFNYFEDSDSAVRARAWRTVGELGRREFVSAAVAAIASEDPACVFWAAWSAVLLGDRERALETLAQIAAVPGPFRLRAFQLTVLAMSPTAAQGWLQSLALDPANQRWLIHGAGLSGDPKYVPWLIGHMADDALARLAGEAFSVLTGLDLARLDLERKPPQSLDSGPNDDPDDPNIEMDEDEGLPWPDEQRIGTWWTENSARFQSDLHTFMGEPLNGNCCRRVLSRGYQRQRIVAALLQSLLNSDQVLFEWRAPAWRQQRLLAQAG